MRARKGEAMPYQSIFRPDLFRDQVMVVTGGGSGIGRCIAHELAALGAMVVITGRTEAKLKTVAAEIEEDGGRADHAVFDIRDEAAVGEHVAEIELAAGAEDGAVLKPVFRGTAPSLVGL